MDLKKLLTIYLPHELTICKFREYVADNKARAFRSGRDKSIVNPDPKGLYTKRKQQQSSTLSASSIEPFTRCVIILYTFYCNLSSHFCKKFMCAFKFFIQKLFFILSQTSVLLNILTTDGVLLWPKCQCSLKQKWMNTSQDLASTLAFRSW